ncbi:MAG: PKD domain-containing protein [Saprospirales bacterium]|nr:PKD domain-containing protein [Saprospirales bacterium]
MRFLPLLIALLLFQAFDARAQFGCDVQDGCGDLPVSGGLPTGSPTFFCEGETVTIVNSTTASMVDTTIICWGDGDCDTYPGPPTTMTHFYNFPFDTCLINATQALQLAITMTVINVCPEGVSQNCIITFVKIKVDPVADFISPTDICAGEPVLFINTTCVNADTATYEWYVDGVFAGFGVDFPYTFPSEGEYDVTLVATNECGEDTYTQQVNVLDVPVAEADFTLDPATGCGPLTVYFENLSQGDEISCFWFGFPSNITFLDTTNAFHCEPVVVFPVEGEYDISLVVTNPCGMDTFTLHISVYDDPVASLAPVQPACEELCFIPVATITGTDTAWQWTFANGIPASFNGQFPPQVCFGQSGAVTLVVSGPCGSDTVSQAVQILNQDIVISSPFDTICSTADPFMLSASPPPSGQNIWSSPTPGLVTPAGMVDPANGVEGWNTLTYSITFSGCPKSDSIQIYILETPEVMVGASETLCLSAGNYQLTFSPDGGIWSGSGIIDSLAGIFNTNLANVGPHLLQYQYTDPANGCVTTMEKTITVVPTPSIAVADTSYPCATLQGIALNVQLNPVFNPLPLPGQVFWSGPGVNSNGIFNSGGVSGAFDLSIQFTIPPGCDTTVFFTLVLSDLTPPEAGPDIEVCQNENTLTLQGTSFDPNAVWSGPAINPLTGEIQLNNLTAPGLYSYSLIQFTGQPCQSSDEVTVFVHPPGGVTVESPAYVCETESQFVLPVPGPGTPPGAWTGPSLVNGNEVNIQNLTPPGPYVYTYTAPSLPDACNSDSVELFIGEQPVPAFSNPPIGCQGVPVAFTNLSTGADEYLWDFGDGLTSNAFQPAHPYSDTGDYTITLEAYFNNPLTGEALCTEIAVGTIHIIAAPEVAFSTDVSEGCGPLEVTITNLSSGEGLNYEWFLDGILFSTDPQPGTIILPPGVELETHTISLSVGNLCATLDVSQVVTVQPQPIAAFGVTNNNPCSGMFIQANNTSTGNVGGSDYFWYLDDVLISTALNPNPLQFFTGSSTTTHILKLVAENACGVDTTETLITVYPTDVIALFNMSDTVLCVGETLSLTGFPTPGAGYSWLILPEGSTYGTIDATHVFGSAGMHEIILYAEGCGYDSMKMVVTVLPLPDVDLNYDLAKCVDVPVEFEVLTDAPNHILYYGDGDSTFAIFSGHPYASEGTYALTLIASSVAGCQNTWAGSVDIVAGPVAAFTPPDPECANVPVTFVSQSTGAAECYWIFGDGTDASGCTANHTFPGTGSYTVTLIVDSPEGCKDTTSQLYYALETPEAFFTYTILEECTPGQVVFEDGSTQSFGIQWSFGGGQPNVSVEYPDGDQYQVTLQAFNGECTDSHTETFTILQSPSIEHVVTPNCTVAEGSNLLITTADAMDWVAVSGENYNAPGDNHPNLPAGDYLISVQSTNGCTAEEEVTVLPPQEIFAQLVEDTFFILLGQRVNLNLQYNLANLQFHWSPETWLNDPSIPDPEAAPFETTSYVVSVWDSLNCFKYDTAYIRVREDRDTSIYLPNAFTPDNTGFNDVFMVRSNNPGMFQVKSFLIYDLNGALVFEARDCQANVPSCGWDGNFKGKPAQQAVYRWQYELEFVDGVVVSHEGLVQLIR